MKKHLFTIIIAILATTFTANAVVIRSRTFGQRTKTHNPTEWILRAGLSINNAAGPATEYVKSWAEPKYDEKVTIGPRVGMDWSIAFNRPIKTSGLYWGMELGMGTRGASMKYSDKYGWEKNSLLTWNVKYSPFTIGYKIKFNEVMKADLHLGAFASYDFAGKGTSSWSDSDSESSNIGDDVLSYFKQFDAGMQAGVGFWFNRFNIDLTYQRGFLTAYDGYELDFENVFSSNIMIRIGVSF